MATERFIDIKVRSSKAQSDVKKLDRSMKGLGKSSDETKTATKELEAALAGASDKIAAQSKKLSKLISVASKSKQANRRLEGSIDELSKSLSESREEATALALRLDKLEKSSSGSSKSLGKLTKVANGVAIAVAAAATATVAMIKVSTTARREQEQMARLVKVSTEEFNALAFATRQYGISAEQIADISKDIADRVGEFSAAGTGTFQDYVDVLRLTKDEAASAAKEFQFMSGPQVIQKMVSEMEKANVTGAQMTFVLESMGNDLSKLQPLFANNGEELRRLTAGFNAVNSELSITARQSKDLAIVSESFDLMSSSASIAATSISAALAPSINAMISDIIENVPTATQAIIDLITSFTEADNINSIKAIDRAITDLHVSILEMRNDSFLGFDTDNTLGIDLAQKRIEDLVAQRAALQNAPATSAPSIASSSVATTGGTTTSVKGDENQKKIDALFEFFNDERLITQQHLQDMFDLETGFRTQAVITEDNRFLAAQGILRARLDEGLILLGEDLLAKQDLRDEFNNTEIAIKAEHEQRITDIELEEAKKREAAKQSAFKNIIDASTGLGIALLKNSITGNAKTEKERKKARKKGVLIDTAAGIARAYAENDFLTATGMAAFIAANGLTQISAINSASTPSFSAGGAGGGAAPQQASATPQAASIPNQTRVVDIRIDDNALLTGAMFKEALNSVLESDTDIAINITNAQSEAQRIGAI